MNVRIVDRVRDIAARVEATPAQVALAWTLAQGPHVVPIPGTRNPAHLDENMAAADVALDDATLAVLDLLPPAEGARYGRSGPPVRRRSYAATRRCTTLAVVATVSARRRSTCSAMTARTRSGRGTKARPLRRRPHESWIVP